MKYVKELKGISTIGEIMAPEEHQVYQQLIFENGNQIRSLNARTAEEASKILEYIRTNGYALIAIEGQPWTITPGKENQGASCE